MKPSQLLATLLLFFCALGICRANLGETEAQCIKRYGAESDLSTDLGYRQVGDKAASFTVTKPNVAYSIRVTFLNGLSCHETFANADSSKGLSLDQLKAILNSQSAGLKWEKGKELYRTSNAGGAGYTYGTIDWLRDDGATSRFYLSSQASSREKTGQLDLSTKQYAYAQGYYDKENGTN